MNALRIMMQRAGGDANAENTHTRLDEQYEKKISTSVPRTELGSCDSDAGTMSSYLSTWALQRHRQHVFWLLSWDWEVVYAEG
jgi:hypothetical protein